MYVSAREERGLQAAFGLLAEDHAETQIRLRLGEILLDLLEADQFASFIWDAGRREFGGRIAINMDPANLDTYRRWHQHHDPITFLLQARRHATRVSDVMPQRELMQTAFFNDFLARDGLHWGMNLHAFAGRDALGDLRIWRRRGRGDFTPRQARLLGLIEPAFVAALDRVRRRPQPAAKVSKVANVANVAMAALEARAAPAATLSAREAAVATAVSEGLTDKQIAQRFGLALPTVRTYLRRCFDKLGVDRRAALGARVASSASRRAAEDGLGREADGDQAPVAVGRTVQFKADRQA